MVPQGLLGIVFCGLGLLPLAPLLACLTCQSVANRVVLSSTRMFLGILACLLGFGVCGLFLAPQPDAALGSLRRFGQPATLG